MAAPVEASAAVSEADRIAKSADKSTTTSTDIDENDADKVAIKAPRAKAASAKTPAKKTTAKDKAVAT